jgi:hypothetical protein
MCALLLESCTEVSGQVFVYIHSAMDAKCTYGILVA